jgi:hypothetical protein
LKNVTVSHPARRADEPLTKWRSFIGCFGKVDYFRARVLRLIQEKCNSFIGTVRLAQMEVVEIGDAR